MTRTPTISLALATCAIAFFALLDVARADAVGRPPDDCVPGAIGRSSHAGRWCRPTTCNADADCASVGVRRALFEGGDHTYICREVDLCVTPEFYHRGDGEPLPRQFATSCTPNCFSPGTCTHEKRCVLASLFPPPTPPTPPAATPPVAVPTTSTPPASTTTPPPAASGGMCAISAGGAVGPALVVLGALALIAARRTRRSARRRPPR